MAHINYVERLNTYYQSQGFPPYRWSTYEDSPWTPQTKPVKECRIALLASGGISRRDQRPFDNTRDTKNDLTVLEIPKDTPVEDLVVNHGYYDHTDADKDVNCVFPVERFRELEEEGFIHRFAPTTFSGFTGRIYMRSAVMQEKAPEVVQRLKKEGVDALFLVPA